MSEQWSRRFSPRTLPASCTEQRERDVYRNKEIQRDTAATVKQVHKASNSPLSLKSFPELVYEAVHIVVLQTEKLLMIFIAFYGLLA
jgi:hypothetical protein